MDVLQHHHVKRCYYGHIHSASCAWAYRGNYAGIEFQLVSADYLNFTPLFIKMEK